MEPLVGKLNHLAITVPWLLHLMGHLYVSLTAALTDSQKHLVHTSKAFCQLLKLIKHNPDSPEEQQISTFTQGETARRIHKSKKKYILLPTAKEELRIIRTALLDNSIIKYSPIAHHVDHTPNGTVGGDSCLRACGGYSIDMEYWWYLEWPPEILNSTLLFIKNNKNGDLVAINGLEYATAIINYAASIHYWCIQDKRNTKNIPYPSVLILIDNTSAESWMRKGCKKSMAGRALGRLQCALMMNCPVGIKTAYINTILNCIADDISRIKSEQNLLLSTPQLFQKYPSLGACRRFHPNPTLISYITDALLSKQPIDPLTIREMVQKNPGKIVGCSIAEMPTSMTRLPLVSRSQDSKLCTCHVCSQTPHGREL
jgi:hypothetical protein